VPFVAFAPGGQSG